MQVDEDVAARGIGPVHEGIGDEFADNNLIVVRDALAKQPIRQLGGFAPVRDLAPNGFEQFLGIEGVIGPGELAHAFAPDVVFEKLDGGGMQQLRPVLPLSDPQHTQLGQAAVNHQEIMLQQLQLGLLLHRFLYPIGSVNFANKPRRFGRIGSVNRQAPNRLGFPLIGVLLRCQPNEVFREQPPRFVRHPDEITGIAGRGDRLQARQNGEDQKLPAARGGFDVTGDRDIVRMLGDALAQPVNQAGIDPLPHWRHRLLVLDAKYKLAALRVGERNTVRRNITPRPFGRIGCKYPDGFLVELLAFSHGASRDSFMRRWDARWS